jgi:hypothetical protein
MCPTSQLIGAEHSCKPTVLYNMPPHIAASTEVSSLQHTLLLCSQQQQQQQH